MRFLADAGISAKTVDVLTGLGHDADQGGRWASSGAPTTCSSSERERTVASS
jgi:hypothetical protein